MISTPFTHNFSLKWAFLVPPCAWNLFAMPYDVCRPAILLCPSRIVESLMDCRVIECIPLIETCWRPGNGCRGSTDGDRTETRLLRYDHNSESDLVNVCRKSNCLERLEKRRRPEGMSVRLPASSRPNDDDAIIADWPPPKLRKR